MKLFPLILAGLFALALSSAAQAEITQIMIRAKAVDAKFIGSNVGGVKAVVEDAETGEILDQGWIKGDTGSTDVLIKNPLNRGERQSDKSTAGFLAKVDINRPRLLRIKLIGPYGYRQSLQQSSLTSWVIPGKDILGDGIVLTMSGFIVDGWTHVHKGGKVDFYTKASMLCGCPISKGGYWDPANFEARVILLQDDKKVGEVPLKFTGPVGLFSGTTTLTQAGYYKAIVYLFDKNTGNVGVDRTMFNIAKP